MGKAHGYAVFPQTPRACGDYGMHLVPSIQGIGPCQVTTPDQGDATFASRIMSVHVSVTLLSCHCDTCLLYTGRASAESRAELGTPCVLGSGLKFSWDDDNRLVVIDKETKEPVSDEELTRRSTDVVRRGGVSVCGEPLSATSVPHITDIY